MNNNRKILYLFTRTPLHVGAGASVGAIDQPIIRERHTGFPVIPASSLKGTFADAWNDDAMRQRQYKRVRKKEDGSWDDNTDAAWLFGSDDANHSFAGALQFSEAKLLAFPIRSARGSFAWITCPLILRRATRDGVLLANDLPDLPNPSDEQALFAARGPLALTTTQNGQQRTQIVLEEYTFAHTGELPANLGNTFKNLFADDPVWAEVANRLVILSDGMMSFFAQNACDVAQHVRIDDETGTAAGGALFNQENVPSETMFYAVVHAFDGRGAAFKTKTAKEALAAFEAKIQGKAFQFGGDASTGLGWCSLRLA
ncbi:MAG: type III-B CRISPR module RAMP protein Cmr4 [Verrucomicrobiae bacterium]|nr:type III-B CRISPR module RAMP protein Cmr4 [Verrucomicrobiae bacterium]